MPTTAYCGEAASPIAFPPQLLLAHHPSPQNSIPSHLHSSQKPISSPSGHDSVISQPVSPKTYSNTSRDARSSTTSHSVQVREEGQLNVVVYDSKPSRDMPTDLEKQIDLSTSNGRPPKNHLPTHDPEELYDLSGSDEVQLEDKALKILLHLSGFCCLLSFLVFIWTLISVVLAALLQPLRFCSMRPDYREQLVKFLGPPLNLQFRFIYASPVSSMYNTPLLLLVHLLAPFVAMGVAFAAWVSAAFWIYAAIIGDPGSKDGHNDGKESVLLVRSYWERWLMRAVR